MYDYLRFRPSRALVQNGSAVCVCLYEGDYSRAGTRILGSSAAFYSIVFTFRVSSLQLVLM